jgi:hypothetical protein
MGVEVAGVGIVPGQLRRIIQGTDGRISLGVSFGLPSARVLWREMAAQAEQPGDWTGVAVSMRQRLVRKLFSVDRARKFEDQDSLRIGLSMLRSILVAEADGPGVKATARGAAPEAVPVWLQSFLLRDEAALDDEWAALLRMRQGEGTDSTAA